MGKRQTREYLLESLILPSARTAPGFSSLVLVLESGQIVTGFLKGETADELEVRQLDDTTVKVRKEEILAREASSVSAMPSVANVLEKREIRDLVEFLASLKGSGE